ncbi:hypothetical protein CJJ23_04865 [Mycoplasmopsis agassizii]|uniref:DUF16 domain-containing protein n=1 Tax=Mycoplasmopsis agassizii TaxID=33922 RepID=A0A269THL3_9BACT|nr:hypothetical protein [Mycoplasmopsis agassizii]PAK20887.1 hypothetical protein CJJ23_04865 [Mycoplasmopsis agassizii]
MSDNKPKDNREELDVTTYCKDLRDIQKNYKLYTNDKKYLFSEEGSKLKHDLSIEGEKIVKEPKKGGGTKKGKNFTDLYNRSKGELIVYIDEKFDEFKDDNNKRHDESKQQIINLEKRFDEFKDENNKKHEESRLESQKQINALEERLNKKIDNRFDEILKAIKENK